MKNTWQLAALLGALFLGGLSACSNIFSFTDCETDADCGKGELCEQNLIGSRCAAICECDTDCKDDEICIKRPSEPSGEARCTRGCRTHGDCDREGDRCIDESCQSGCYRDEQCEAGEFCDQYSKCATRECELAEDCGVGFVCNGRCVEGCFTDEDCPGGEGCSRRGADPGTCTPAACIDDEDCDAELSCLCGRCISHCERDEECADGERCTLAIHECEPRTCSRGGDVSCGETICPEFSENETFGDLLVPCCIGEPEDGVCGFRPVDLLAKSDRCGEPIVLTSSCDCAEGECCLSDGSCGWPTKPLAAAPGAFDLCMPKAYGASASCEAR